MVRITARLVALLAIAAVAVGVYVIVNSNVGTSSSSPAHRGTRHHHRRHARAHAHAHAHHAQPTSYTVRAGDTLSDIARRVHVSVSTLESLNPSVNPNALQTGQRLRLRR